MTTIEKIRKEIERLRKNYVLSALDSPDDAEKIISAKYKSDLCKELLAFLNTLEAEEQHEVNLKKGIKEWTDLMVGASFPEQDGDFISEEDYRSVIRQTAIHFLGLNSKK